MPETERFRPRIMWSMTSESQRLELLQGLTVPEDPDLPLGDFVKQDYDELPGFICGRLIVAQTPDGWNTQDWHLFKKIADSGGVKI